MEEASLEHAALGKGTSVVADCKVEDRKLPIATRAKVKGILKGRKRTK